MVARAVFIYDKTRFTLSFLCIIQARMNVYRRGPIVFLLFEISCPTHALHLCRRTHLPLPLSSVKTINYFNIMYSSDLYGRYAGDDRTARKGISLQFFSLFSFFLSEIRFRTETIRFKLSGMSFSTVHHIVTGKYITPSFYTLSRPHLTISIHRGPFVCTTMNNHRIGDWRYD